MLQMELTNLNWIPGLIMLFIMTSLVISYSRKMLNSEDICFKDVFMRGEDKSRLPVPDIFDGFIDKINAKITELYEWYEA